MLGSLFSGKRDQAWNSFRQQVLSIARARFPQIGFEASFEDPHIVYGNGARFGLTTLKEKFDKTDGSLKALEELVCLHCGVIAGMQEEYTTLQHVFPLLRPQLMQPHWQGLKPRNSIVTLPFSDSLLLGIVIDDEQGYVFVQEDQVETWGMPPEELLYIALGNLEAATPPEAIETTESPVLRLVSVAVGDSYDSARILLPRLRDTAAAHLGSPFNFGVSNRGLLLCWNADAPAEVVESIRVQMAKDFASQPYPLSPFVHETGFDGEIVQVG